MVCPKGVEQDETKTYRLKNLKKWCVRKELNKMKPKTYRLKKLRKWRTREELNP